MTRDQHARDAEPGSNQADQDQSDDARKPGHAPASETHLSTKDVDNIPEHGADDDVREAYESGRQDAI